METVVRLLPFVLPPLAGAVIGYVTNALAIRMLFRPLEEKRVFGIRVPLTPGIIPRQRHQLAHSIARMVSQKLLTPDLLAARLDEPEFQEALERSVARFTSDVLAGPRGEADEPRDPVRELEPTDPAVVEEARGGLTDAAQGILSSFFYSARFADVVHRIAESVVEGAMRAPAGRVIPESSRLAALVDGAVLSLSQGPTAEAAEHAVQRWVASHLERNTPLEEIVGAETMRRIGTMLPGIYEPAFEGLLAFLNDPSTRQELSVHGKSLLDRVLRRLNVFQRFLVSAGQYDRNLRENMPAIVDDVIASVGRAGRDPANRDRLIESLQDELRLIGESGIRSLLDRFGLHADRLVTRVFELAVELLAREDVRRRISEGVTRFADRHRDAELGTLTGSLLGLDPDDLASRLVGIADRWVADVDNVERLATRVTEFVLRFLGRGERRPLSDLLPLSDEQKRRMDRFLADRLRGLVGRRVPEIIAGLDVYTMVVNKIEGLDMESVEQLLLMVIAKHLKWINLFGALLGSLIGGMQVLIGMVS